MCVEGTVFVPCKIPLSSIHRDTYELANEFTCEMVIRRLIDDKKRLTTAIDLSQRSKKGSYFHSEHIWKQWAGSADFFFCVQDNKKVSNSLLLY